METVELKDLICLWTRKESPEAKIRNVLKVWGGLRNDGKGSETSKLVIKIKRRSQKQALNFTVAMRSLYIAFWDDMRNRHEKILRQPDKYVLKVKR